jgi:hypothetical protein
MDLNVALIRMFPGISAAAIAANLAPPMRGAVLQTYGAGNVPERDDLLDVLRAATARGVVIVNCSQCTHGDVSPAYRAGRVRVFMCFSGITSTVFDARTYIQDSVRGWRGAGRGHDARGRAHQAGVAAGPGSSAFSV